MCYCFRIIPITVTISALRHLLSHPISGDGASVTITGTNFSTTPTNNLAAFNGTAAVVTSQYSYFITTSVLVGAARDHARLPLLEHRPPV
ncbi:MAG: IPT/TIG domain-containing protein [Cytophagales bacterium]|nr:IPT/TIG domain-containing protein [Cytophagales bacterium]